MLKQSDALTEFFGACPDCNDGKCTMNCDDGTINIREIIMCAVLEMEATPRADAHSGIMKMLRRLQPALRDSALREYERRNGTAPIRSLGPVATNGSE